LPPRNLTGHVTIAAASRGESQVTANEGWSLISEFEVSSFRSKPSNLEFGKKIVNSLLASHYLSIARFDHCVWLKQSGHATDVTCVLSRYQQPLQVLGIVGRLFLG
jgi:hypothetical protein